MTDYLCLAQTVGRRKTAIANLKLIPGSGKISIKGRSALTFFSGYPNRLQVIKIPFRILNDYTFDAHVKLQGGGFSGQAAALQLALARALVRVKAEQKILFRENFLLTRDSRKKERRKYGLKKARKAKQFSKRLFYFIFMSQATNEILEKLKTLTLIETADLASDFRDTFGVSLVRSRGEIIAGSGLGEAPTTEPAVESKTTFDVILESVASDKRVATLKAIRSLTRLGLKEAKDFCSSLPKAVKEGVSKEEAEATKVELENAGGCVKII
jgi:large subunit ribosomal protein L7/L12